MAWGGGVPINGVGVEVKGLQSLWKLSSCCPEYFESMGVAHPAFIYYNYSLPFTIIPYYKKYQISYHECNIYVND